MSSTDATESTPDTPKNERLESPEQPESEAGEGTPRADGAEPDSEGSPNAEAAKYRRRLRDAEDKLATAAQAVEAQQRAYADHIAAEVLHKPAALWGVAGVTVADLLDPDSGLVDPGLVRAACNRAVDDYGLARNLGGDYVPAEGRNPRRHGSGDPFADALRARQ